MAKTRSGKSLVYKVLPVCAKERSSLICTDYHPFVVILSRVRGFVVKKIIIFTLQYYTCGVHRNVADSARPSLAFQKTTPTERPAREGLAG